MMQRIIIISIALVYFKASVFAASTAYPDPNPDPNPDPEHVGGDQRTHLAHENIIGQLPNQTAENVTGQPTNQTAENIIGQLPNQTAENVTGQAINQTAENVTGQPTNQTAGSVRNGNCTHPTMWYEQIVRLTKCSVPLLPTNGGLVCVYFDNILYCKPMCNQGYDFSFLRRSRLYEECGSKTAFTWTTQYIGGSRLAECIASGVLVSGQPSAYFGTEKCEEAVSHKERKQKYIDEFISELKKQDIGKNHKKELDIVACGNC